MKKLIGALGLVSLLSLGFTETASAQFGGVNLPTRQVSARTKGAIIGGGLGAAAGAIIHRRDPVAGGIVGAVVGAGAGYVIGNNEDKIRREQQQMYYRGGHYRQDNYYQQRSYKKGHGYKKGHYKQRAYRR